MQFLTSGISYTRFGFKMFGVCSNSRVVNFSVDSADTLAFFGGNAHETIVTPGGAPGVSHEPIVKTGVSVSAVTDHYDGVIKLGAARMRVNHTTGVGLEHAGASIESD